MKHTFKKPAYLNGYTETIEKILAAYSERFRDAWDVAREYTVRYFRTIGIKYRLAKRYIPEELGYAICDAYSLQSLIDAPKGTMFYALPERDPLWCVDEVYPPLKRLPRYGTLPAEAIQLINELYAAGKSEEARHVLEARAEANHVSQAGLRATRGFTCPSLIKAFLFSREQYPNNEELSPWREMALKEVCARVVALREVGNEVAAYAAMAEAIDSGEITYSEACVGCYLKQDEKCISPTWFTKWSIERERELNKAANLPYEHLVAL